MIFADTFYFFAMLNIKDGAHLQAIHFSQTSQHEMLTTEWVITELADGMCLPGERMKLFKFIEAISHHSKMTIVPASHALFEAGWALYGLRPDKEWSLTDCISFTVMQQHGITEALTGDHHFQQAGFVALLK